MFTRQAPSTSRRASRLACASAALIAALACAPPPETETGVVPVPDPASASPGTRSDTASLVPAGFGSLKQDDIALRLQRFGLQVRALPLDEAVIRLLSPDSYRALRDLQASQQPAFAAITRRTGLRNFSLWYVSFFSQEQGETRFSPMEFIITNVGRDFRPIDVIALSPGFGEQRLRQRETQSALYVFDPQVDVNQPLAVAYETTRNEEWGGVLSALERERALVRSRAARRLPPP